MPTGSGHGQLDQRAFAHAAGKLQCVYTACGQLQPDHLIVRCQFQPLPRYQKRPVR